MYDYGHWRWLAQPVRIDIEGYDWLGQAAQLMDDIVVMKGWTY